MAKDINLTDISANLPPGPYSIATNGSAIDRRGFIYLLDGNGRKIGTFWGSWEEKNALAGFMVFAERTCRPREVEKRVLIRIIKTPPGFADEDVRKAWVGVEIPLAPEDEAEEAAEAMDATSESVGGPIVRGEDAVAALSNNGQHRAANYWKNPVAPSYFRFAADCCEIVSSE